MLEHWCLKHDSKRSDVLFRNIVAILGKIACRITCKNLSSIVGSLVIVILRSQPDLAIPNFFSWATLCFTILASPMLKFTTSETKTMTRCLLILLSWPRSCGGSLLIVDMPTYITLIYLGTSTHSPSSLLFLYCQGPLISFRNY